MLSNKLHSSQPDVRTLRQILLQRCNDEDLRDFCFLLNIEYEDLSGAGRAGKSRELLRELARRNRLADLVDLLQRERPDIDWSSVATLPAATSMSGRASPDQRPPRFAAYLLRFLPKEQRDALLGDLEEEYREIYAQHGRRQAWFWYWCQALTSFGPLLWRAVRNLTKWGILAWLGDVVRRIIS
jgi:hypothetical protein